MSVRRRKSDKKRPCFSGHETFPLRYGWLQKAFEAVNQAQSPKDAVHVFRDPDSIARFGVGRNMVGAIRYWATGTGVLKETDEGLEVSWLGNMLFGEGGIDPYLEEDSSLWLLHWHLAGRTRLTSAFWLFNEFRGSSFVRKDIVSELLKLARGRFAPTTVDRDLQCLLRTYLGGRGSSEAGDSILAELGLIHPLDRHRSRLSRGRKPSLPESVFIFCLNEFWSDCADGQNTMSFENVSYAPRSPGRVSSWTKTTSLNDSKDLTWSLPEISPGRKLPAFVKSFAIARGRKASGVPFSEVHSLRMSEMKRHD